MNPASIKHATVVIVDDDPTVLELLKVKLSGFKWMTVITITNPLEAIYIITEQLPDLVVCDIDMDEVDGCEVARRLQAQSATEAIPVIFLSSLISPADVERGKGTIGGRRMISKQTPLHKIVATIVEAVP